ncbi:MAG: hypothetical protein ACKOQ6_01230 [Bacteroidota bacterium]
MDLLDDELYAYDERGLNGFDRFALEFVIGFLGKLQQRARTYGLDGNDVMLLSQAIQVVGDFMRVDYDGWVRITCVREDGLGQRSSDLELTPARILIGVSGRDSNQRGVEPYSDPYFIIGNEDENTTLDDDLDIWEEEFFQKLTFPDAKVKIEGEISNINEQGPGNSDGMEDPWEEE